MSESAIFSVGGKSNVIQSYMTDTERDKLWASGAHQCPNTLKYLAGDPDLSFTTYSYESDSDGEISTAKQAKTTRRTDPESVFSHQPCDSLNYVPLDDNSTNAEVILTDTNQISEIEGAPIDLPLSSNTREGIVSYLNQQMQEKLNN